ncbi:MAG: trehalase family glycosidase [Imperialibacter sp.]|uniref:amylo-alpha-1,6-glucosidase n=1 Tax=Imperialibacter sp. TaxID=2038411 RepID=UPI0032EFEBC1
MLKRDSLVPFLIFSVCFLHSCETPQPVSENIPGINADASSPIYTTYAAARDRSAFVLDEGYEFVFNDDETSPVFTSDTGGEIGFSFATKDSWIYKTGDYAQKPVIYSSFPDEVNFSFSPVDGIEVKSKFLVYSSVSAVLESTFTNNTDSTVSIDYIPFVQGNSRLFNGYWVEDGVLHFNHEEFPDTWTVGHKVPFTDSLQNLFKMSAEPDRFGAFSSFSEEGSYLPWKVFPDKKPVKEVNGRLYNEDGQRVMTQLPKVRLQAYVDNDTKHLLTESSPVFGSLQGALNSDGYFRMELSQLPGTGRAAQYTLTAVDETLGIVAQRTDSIPSARSQFSGSLRPSDIKLPAAPQRFEVIMQEKKRAALSWSKPSDGSQVIIYRKKENDSYYTQFTRPLSTTNLMVQLPTDDLYCFIAVGAGAGGEIGMHTRERTTLPGSSLKQAIALNDWKNDSLKYFKIAAYSKSITLPPGQSTSIRVARSVAPMKEKTAWKEAEKLLDKDFTLEMGGRLAYLESMPELPGLSADQQLLYLSGWNMMQQVFYPAEGKSSYPYYVFSREPVWGWGHGGQVFHESLTMLALVLQDPELAMNSQRVFKERQYENGYINYRTGGYLDEIIEHEGELTSSAPWYAWINWEVYKITQDKAFLAEMYESSKRFYEFYVSNRDKDGDGLCEWGGHAILESVRDADVAVWDEVGWPANFEAVDLNSMLVMEAKSLEQMAAALGKTDEAARWKADHEQRAVLINGTFWDETTGFYYNADKADNDFTFEKTDDLKRMEIIGFLPMWAGIASKEQADRLVEHLTNPDKFWRPYGVPSLVADDPFYNDKGYWNGPVWVEWDYLIQRGLQNYGYDAEAKELVDRVSASMIYQLKENHNLWEFYSPDEPWAGYHRTYIWAGIVNRMMWDVYSPTSQESKKLWER